MSAKFAWLGLGVMALFIFGNFYFQLTGGPSRTLTARLDPYGDISVHLETEPDPPKTGRIPLMIHLTDQDGNRIAVDKVQYEYAFQDREPKALIGEGMEVGAFKAVAVLTDVGEWQIDVTLFKGSQQTQVKFTLRVGANI